jgi:protein-L-isoaspartate(D-aspartate) O-methyltransferase
MFRWPPMRHVALKVTMCRLVFIGLLLSACLGPRPTPKVTYTRLPTAETTAVLPSATAAGPTTQERADAGDERLDERLAMVRDTIEARSITDPGVLAAMQHVPRHRFVPTDYADQAYADHPLPIGFGQTISQPYIVAWMTELLDLEPGDKVLEIGTGSGYQAAVLAEIPEVDVYTIEIVPELAERATETLYALGYTEIHCLEGDGYYGWDEYAPFDAIIVTAAPDHLPQPLAQQLGADGRLVIPIGPPGGYQSLWRFTVENGELSAENVGGVIFVPFTGPGIGHP